MKILLKKYLSCRTLYLSIIFIDLLGCWRSSLFTNGITLSEQVANMTSSRTYTLIDTLMDSYKSHVRPVYNASTQTVVSFNFQIDTIVELDDVNAIVRLLLATNLTWNDEFLVWNTSSYKDIDHFMLDADQQALWMPKLSMLNTKTEEYLIYSPTVFDVRSDGTITVLWNWLTITSCPSTIYKFPFDTVNCTLKFGILNLKNNEMKLMKKEDKLKSKYVTSYSASLEWDLEDVLFDKSRVSNEKVELHYNISMSRRPDYYFFNLILPNTLVLCITPFQFMLPVEAGERIGIGMTILLQMSVLIMIVADKLPHASLCTPIISVYFGAGNILAVIALALNMLSIYYHNNAIDELRIVRPGRFSRMMYFVLGRIFCVSRLNRYRKKRPVAGSNGGDIDHHHHHHRHIATFDDVNSDDDDNANAKNENLELTDFSADVTHKSDTVFTNYEFCWKKLSLAVDRFSLFICYSAVVGILIYGTIAVIFGEDCSV